MSEASTNLRRTIKIAPPRIISNDFGIMVLLFLGALLTRCLHHFDFDLTFDEVVLLYLARESYGQIWHLCQFDNFAPLYPWLVKLWTTISWDPGWIRLLSALLGSLTPPAAYLLGKEITNRKFGFFLGLACVISTSLVLYSLFIRMFNVQPMLVCLSLFWFLNALKSNSWKFWILTALANLIGFYVYYFMLLVVVAQGMVLMLHYRGQLRNYVRPLIAFALFLVGVLPWGVTLLQRYENLNEGFWIQALTLPEYIKVWVFLGSGTDFGNAYLLAALLNLPFLVGIVMTLFHKPRNEAIHTVFLVLVLSLALLTLISLLGQPFFNKRYILFLLPLYLAGALFGWMEVRKIIWRRLGLSLIGISLIAGLIYYYNNSYSFHYPHLWFFDVSQYDDGSNGRALSLTAAQVAARLQKDEIIIHYSDVRKGTDAFFASRYYHHYSLPEYIFSSHNLTLYNGRQYLAASEHVAALSDFKIPPGGIWVVTSRDLESYFNGQDLPLHFDRSRFPYSENLPDELRQERYRSVEVLRYGNVIALHYRRDEPNPTSGASENVTVDSTQTTKTSDSTSTRKLK